MARCYVFATQAEAVACVERINVRARVVYRLQGYEIDRATGAIIGKCAADGTSMWNAARTLTWDIPRQRLDGKWVVRHCEAVPGATFVLKPLDSPPLNVAAYVAQDIAVTVTVEVENEDWWPAPPRIEVQA